ncbi:MAG: xylanase [Blastopirellula sp.]|nr:MAG: xylanase [Blastopirellula sp.]
MAYRFLLLAILLFSPVLCIADELPELDLWPAGHVPGQSGAVKEEIVEVIDAKIGRKTTKVTKPKITVYKPDAKIDTKAAVVICPGGGYHILAYDLEGVEVAKWLNSIGVTGVVVHYRVPRSKEADHRVGPMQDAQRAIRLTRQNAEKWNLDPNRIGLMGFSAGGHLTAATGTGHEKKTYSAIDDADKLSARPDFLMMIYPAYLNREGSDTELDDFVMVDKNTPPTFLIHAGNDGVSATNSLAFYLAMKRLALPAELHIFPDGGHGYGLRPTEKAVTGWPKLAERWLQTMKIIGNE